MNEQVLITMSKDELKHLISEEVSNAVKSSIATPTTIKVYKGTKGIKEIFGVGQNTAIKIKNSGVIESAITYSTTSRNFQVDAEKAKQLWNKHIMNIRNGVR